MTSKLTAAWLANAWIAITKPSIYAATQSHADMPAWRKAQWAALARAVNAKIQQPTRRKQSK